MDKETFEHRKIRVTYPDGKGEHITTFAEIHEKFKDERPEWLQNFVSRLIMTGTAYTNFGGKYELI